jgi:hypothetical protein
MSVSVNAQSGDLLSRVVSWWDTLGRKANDPVEGLGVPLSAKCLFLFGWRSPLGSASKIRHFLTCTLRVQQTSNKRIGGSRPLFFRRRDCFRAGAAFVAGHYSLASRSAFRAKADMAFCGNPLLRSLLGVKRTCRFALHMSAFDPKRT